jgi:hypothetical protein
MKMPIAAIKRAATAQATISSFLRQRMKFLPYPVHCARLRRKVRPHEPAPMGCGKSSATIIRRPGDEPQAVRRLVRPIPVNQGAKSRSAPRRGDAPTGHPTHCFALVGDRAIYKNGLMASQHRCGCRG